MRCKNCGAENDESRFICEICGSPLYDENDEIKSPDAEQEELIDTIDYNDYEEEAKKKRNIIIAIVAAVAVVAIIVGCVFAFSLKKDDETTTSTSAPLTSTTETSTKKQTTTESTTASTTESTTKPTTTAPTTTTTIATYKIAIDIDGNGTVTGDGAYESGKKAALVATPDEGYQFSGWFDNATGKLVASGNKYTITVKENLNLTAKFEKAVAEE